MTPMQFTTIIEYVLSVIGALFCIGSGAVSFWVLFLQPTPFYSDMGPVLFFLTIVLVCSPFVAWGMVQPMLYGLGIRKPKLNK